MKTLMISMSFSMTKKTRLILRPLSGKPQGEAEEAMTVMHLPRESLDSGASMQE